MYIYIYMYIYLCATSAHTHYDYMHFTKGQGPMNALFCRVSAWEWEPPEPTRIIINLKPKNSLGQASHDESTASCYWSGCGVSSQKCLDASTLLLHTLSRSGRGSWSHDTCSFCQKKTGSQKNVMLEHAGACWSMLERQESAGHGK